MCCEHLKQSQRPHPARQSEGRRNGSRYVVHSPWFLASGESAEYSKPGAIVRGCEWLGFVVLQYCHMTTIFARDFSNRSALEAHIRSTWGNDSLISRSKSC